MNQVPHSAMIAPTETTCGLFASGTASSLETAYYGLRKNAINNVAPGVMFYYSRIVAPSASFTLQVPQANTHGWKPVPVQDLKQVILYGADCLKSPAQGNTTYSPSTGLVTVHVQGAVPGAVYILGIKYDLSALTGQRVPSPWPTVTYAYETVLDGAPITTSSAAIKIAPK